MNITKRKGPPFLIMLPLVVIMAVIITAILIIFNSSGICYAEEYVPRKILYVSDPDLKIKEFKAVKIITIPYGQSEEQVGYYRLTKTDQEYGSDMLYFDANIIRVLWGKNGEIMVFDWFNENIKIFDADFRFKEIVKLKGLHRVFGDLIPPYLSIRLGFNSQIIFIRAFINSTTGDLKYYPFYINTKKFDRGYPKYFKGSANLITQEDPRYKTIEKLLSKAAGYRDDFLSYSFCEDANGDGLLFSIRRKTCIEIYKVSSGGFKLSGSVPCPGNKLEDQLNDIRIFSSPEYLYLFADYGYVKNENQVGDSNDRTIYKQTRMMVLDRKGCEEVFSRDIVSSGLDYYTLHNGQIYTWDYSFNTNEFNIYRLEYTGDAPRLKEIFDKPKKSANNEEDICNRAIEIVKNRKLHSGRTIEEELKTCFPIVEERYRNWKASVSKNRDEIEVQYVLSAGNFDSICFRWSIPLDSQGKIKNGDTCVSTNTLAHFLSQADERYRRDKILIQFNEKEREIYEFLSETIGNNDLPPKEAKEYDNRIMNAASKRYGMSRTELKEIYDKIYKALFESEDQ